VLVLASLILAAAPSAGGPAGRWHGSSLCQVKSSPCRDEEAVYHIGAKGGGRYAMAMNKVVGGVEQEMGVIDAVFTPASGLLTGTTFDRRGQPARWTFRLHGDRLSGRLVTADGIVYRLIEVSREPAPAR
jgi:hypothetical protein